MQSSTFLSHTRVGVLSGFAFSINSTSWTSTGSVVPLAYGLALHALPKSKSGIPVGLGNSFYAPVKDGAVFFSMPTLGEFEVGDKADVDFKIEFDQAVSVANREIVPTLKGMVQDVEFALRVL